MTEALERILCPVSGAVFVKKLAKARSGIGKPKSAAKRPKLPDLSTDQPPKAKAAKGRGSNKGRGKGKGRISTKSKAKPKKSAESILDLKEDDFELDYVEIVSSGRNSQTELRDRKWCDDAIKAILSVSPGFFDVMQIGDSRSRIFGYLISFCIEFCIAGRVMVLGSGVKAKPLKDWSKAANMN